MLVLLQRQTQKQKLSVKRVLELAKEHTQADEVALRACTESGKTKDRLAADIEYAAAHQIAGLNAPAVVMAKEAVNRAYEVPLREGLLFERRVFHSLFATEDQKEGMAAFLEKRQPQFRDK